MPYPVNELHSHIRKFLAASAAMSTAVAASVSAPSMPALLAMKRRQHDVPAIRFSPKSITGRRPNGAAAKSRGEFNQDYGQKCDLEFFKGAIYM